MKNKVLKYSLIGAGLLTIFASTLYYIRLKRIQKINETNAKLKDVLQMINDVK
jgi:hypothetical protein